MNGAEVTFVGNLTKTPELRMSSSGNPWLSFSIAVNERSRGRDGETKENTVFFNCKAFGEMAENIAATANKGDRIVVNGRIRTDSWQDSEGTEQRREIVYVDELAMSLRWAQGQIVRTSRGAGRPAAQPAASQPAADEGNPFA